MLDLLIAYFNFIILSIKYIIRKILFQPPKPSFYKIIENSNNNKVNYQICIKNKNFKYYHKIKKKVQLEIEFQKIPDNYNNYIPLFIFKPTLSLHNACIIYCHGNSCDIGTTFNECCDLAKLTKCIIVSFDYPGYGMYKNIEPNEKNLYESLQIIYKFVKDELKFDENSIIVYGFSLGTGVAFNLACNKNYNFGGLILQSPFLSIFRTIYNTPKTKYYDLFNNCDKAKLLNIKTLFIHGNNDKIVPYIHGRILADLIPKNKLYRFETINGAGHNDILVPKNLISLSEIIKEFIEHCCNSIKFKDNKTVKIKKMNKFNYNFDITPKFYSSFNESIINSKKVDINDNENENRTLSENNSVFLSRKKESFLGLLKSYKNEESNLIKTNSKYVEIEEKNGFESEEKFLKNNKFLSKFNINDNEKTKVNSIYKSNDIKGMNFCDLSINQKDELYEDTVDFNESSKKAYKVSLQKIIDISKSE